MTPVLWKKVHSKFWLNSHYFGFFRKSSTDHQFSHQRTYMSMGNTYSFINGTMTYGCLQILHRLPMIPSLITILRPPTIPQKWTRSFCQQICHLIPNTQNESSSTELFTSAELVEGIVRHFVKYAYSLSCRELVSAGSLPASRSQHEVTAHNSPVKPQLVIVVSFFRRI